MRKSWVGRRTRLKAVAQLGHVKDRMNLRVWREFQLVCSIIDLGDDLVWSIVLERQLMVGSPGDGGLNVWLELEVNQIAHLEGMR